MSRLSPLPSPGRPPPIRPFHKKNSIGGKPSSLPFQKVKGCKPKCTQDWAAPRDGSWRGWTSGVEPTQAVRGSRAEREPVCSVVTSSCAGNISTLTPQFSPSPRLLSQRTPLGFPDDLVGARPLPHLATFLSALWRLPTKKKSSFCGGWRFAPIRPLPSTDLWPRVGIGSQIPRDLAVMDPKGKNTKWERPNPKPQRQNSPPWGRHRNLSWRLRPPHVKTEIKNDSQISSSGEGADLGNKNPTTHPAAMDLDLGRRLFCQKCGDEGHHARDCFKPLCCEICRKETHVTAKCVWPKQSKPTMPIVGMAADGLGFYASQFAKNAAKKPRKSFLGLVKVLEGEVRCEDLEQDFSFHFPWGRTWKATKCPSGFLMQFPSQERLDEVVNFPELKMKISGIKISVIPWSSQAKAKSRLHTTWVVAENVPEELLNYQAICELGSTIGAVEEIDLISLESKDMVRFKVHVKSIDMIPEVIEVGVKPYLYDIFFKVENIDAEGWNDDSVSLGKRASVDVHRSGKTVMEKCGKKAKNEDFMTEENDMIIEYHSGSTSKMIGSLISHGKSDKISEVIKEGGEKEGSEGDVDFNESEDDLLSSRELDVLVKDMGMDAINSQDDMLNEKVDSEDMEKNADDKNKKNKGKGADVVEGTRKSSRLETNEDIKITEKAISRAVAKDAFLNKGTSSNPFSVLNSNDDTLIEIADLLNVSLGKNKEEIILNLDEIKRIENERLITCDSNSNFEQKVNMSDDENEHEIAVSIDKMVQELLDSESDKEKMLVHNRKKDIRREKKYSLRNKKKKNSPNVRCTPNKRSFNRKEGANLIVP
jgi:hypothetical protein